MTVIYHASTTWHFQLIWSAQSFPDPSAIKSGGDTALRAISKTIQCRKVFFRRFIHWWDASSALRILIQRHVMTLAPLIIIKVHGAGVAFSHNRFYQIHLSNVFVSTDRNPTTNHGSSTNYQQASVETFIVWRRPRAASPNMVFWACSCQQQLWSLPSPVFTPFCQWIAEIPHVKPFSSSEDNLQNQKSPCCSTWVQFTRRWAR